MNLDKVNEAIAKRFQAHLPHPYKRRILFWYDEEAEFYPYLDHIDFGSAKLLVIHKNYFEIKHTLEVADTESDYVVYSPEAKPDYRQNWLLDILLYSEEFSADRASIIMDELGIENLGLKEVIRRNIQFFDNKNRFQGLKDLDVPLRSERDIQLAMMTVVCRCKAVDLESILFNIFLDKIEEEDNERFQQISKYPGTDAFWRFVKEYLGYESESPTLKKLFHNLVLTITASQLKRQSPSGWGHFMLPKRNNAQVLVDHWIYHKEHSGLFEQLAEKTFHELEIQKQIQDWQPEECLEADTFSFFDKIIILGIVNKMLDDQEDYETWLSWITNRKSTHWYSSYEDMYRALEAAIELFRFRHRFTGSFPKLAPAEMMEKYAQDYYRADQLYRQFYQYYDKVTNDTLKSLAPKIDDLYCNWFLENLSHTWSDVVEDHLTQRWWIDGVRPQTDFYRYYIKNNVLQKNERDKIFVIISDAMRYEIAKELENELQKELRGETTLEYMQGCVPSFTGLGMASLLPNKEIRINEKNRICVQGIDTATTPHRETILQSAYEGSAALKLLELVSATKEKAREMIRDCRVVYLYHNTIDATGEKPETEMKLFDAVSGAIREITEGVKKIVNSLGTTNVIITTDHGFLFQKSQIHESDKIEKAGIQGIINNRRFLLAEKGDSVDGSLQISLKPIFGNESNFVAYVPRGNIRFKHSGGIHYVHGGASLQEIMIPVLHYTHARKESRKAKETQKAEVKLTNTTKKITNNIFTLQFFQTEKISPKMLPRKLRVSLWDEEGKKVSTEEIIHADRESDRPEDRTFSIRLKLLSGIQNGKYALRLIDDETQMEYDSIPFEVNVGISIDFDDF